MMAIVFCKIQQKYNTMDTKEKWNRITVSITLQIHEISQQNIEHVFKNPKQTNKQ